MKNNQSLIHKVSEIMGPIADFFDNVCKFSIVRKKNTIYSMDIFNRIKNVLWSIENEFIREKCQQHTDKIVSEFKRLLTIDFEMFQIEYSKKERLHIQECITKDCIFNLTNEPISDDIKKFIEKGPKYTPFTQTNTKRTIRNFDQSFCEIINRIIKRTLPYTSISVPPKNGIKKGLRDMCKLAKQKKKQNYKIIKEVTKSYNIERKRFYNFSSLKATQPSKHLVEES